MGRRGAEKKPRSGFGERERTTPSGGPFRDEERSDEQPRRAHQLLKILERGFFYWGAGVARQLYLDFFTFIFRLILHGNRSKTERKISYLIMYFLL